MMTKSIPLSQGRFALIDDDDFGRVGQFKWTFYRVSPRAVYAGRVDYQTGKTIYLHRFIMNAPAGSEVDHRDHDGLNNQKTNLRIATRRENSQNQKKPNRSNKTSQYKGVSRYYNKWRAIIKFEGKDLIIGSFHNEMDAAIAYDSAAKQYYGEFAYVNFPAVR